MFQIAFDVLLIGFPNIWLCARPCFQTLQVLKKKEQNIKKKLEQKFYSPHLCLQKLKEKLKDRKT